MKIMDLRIDIIDNYFSTINPIARKIHLDISETKSSYEHIWNELNSTEQTDIINETLIKPEIALRYFDSFSSRLSSATTSTASSSICNNANNENDDIDNDLKNLLTDKIQNSIYMYDGKNLKTYTGQKTAQKLIHDDVIGVFRDEHSAPFSFKTKSQINLNLFNNTQTAQSQQAVLKQPVTSSIITDPTGSTTPTITSSATNRSADNQISNLKYQQQQINSKNNELTALKSSMLPTLVKNITNTGKKYERFYNDEKLSAIKASSIVDNEKYSTTMIADTGIADVAVVVCDNDDDKINFITKFICKNNLIFNTTNQNEATKTNRNAATASIDDDDDFENKVLMNNVCYSGELNSSSSIQSEEDDDKHTFEDSKLLLETTSDDMRKGFDFLNNW